VSVIDVGQDENDLGCRCPRIVDLSAPNSSQSKEELDCFSGTKYCPECISYTCTCGVSDGFIGNQYVCDELYDQYKSASPGPFPPAVAFPLVLRQNVLLAYPDPALYGNVLASFQIQGIVLTRNLKRRLLGVCREGSDTAVPLTNKTVLTATSTACLVRVKGAYVVGVENASVSSNPEVMKLSFTHYNVGEMIVLCGSVLSFETMLASPERRDLLRALSTLEAKNMIALRAEPNLPVGICAGISLPVKNMDRSSVVVTYDQVSVLSQPTVIPVPCHLPSEIVGQINQGLDTIITVSGERKLLVGVIRPHDHCVGATWTSSRCFADRAFVDVSPVKLQVSVSSTLAVICSGGVGPLSVRLKASPHVYFPVKWYTYPSFSGTVFVCNFGSETLGLYEVQWDGMSAPFEVGLVPRSYSDPFVYVGVDVRSMTYLGTPTYYGDEECVDIASLLEPTGPNSSRPICVMRRPRAREPLHVTPFKFRVGYPTYYELDGVLYMGIGKTPNFFSVCSLCQDIPIGVRKGAKVPSVRYRAKIEGEVYPSYPIMYVEAMRGELGNYDLCALRQQDPVAGNIHCTVRHM